MLGWQKFASDAEVQSAVRQMFGQQSTSFFFASGIQNLVDGWDKCLIKFKPYVDKLNINFDV